MSVVTTSGRLIWSNHSFDGKMDDPSIMRMIFERPHECDAVELLEFLKANKVLLIADRGFERFKNYLQTPDVKKEYPNLDISLPVNKTDKDQRYTRETADKSRLLVTSCREIVECYHGQQKIFNIMRHPLDIKFHMKHFLNLHRIINAIINRFGIRRRALRSQPTFEADERYLLLTQNDNILDSDLYLYVTEPGHDLNYTKRSRIIWRELYYDSGELRNLFPSTNENTIKRLTAGPYLYQKARSYKKTMFELYHQRKQQQINRLNMSTSTTASALAPSHLTYKIERLSPYHLEKHFPTQGFTSLVRFDVNSFYKGSNKFKSYIAIKKQGPTDGKYSFGCTCSTGSRTTPCVHSILILRLFSEGNF